MRNIVAVNDKKKLAAFIDFPHDLHKNDPNYVPELFIAQSDMLTPGKHPFHEHSTLQCFLAYEGDKVVGRIAAIQNNNHNKKNNTTEGHFGFFDCINDQETADQLIEVATKWLKERNMTSMVGPLNFSTNDICALLIEGFDGPPVAMMPYNPPYYLQLLENAGFAKKVDLRAYKFLAGAYNDRSLKLAEAIQERLKRNNIIIRKINMKDFWNEVVKVREVYNAAWDHNTGFVPATDKEFHYLAKDLKMIVDPDFVYIAEQEGKMVAISLSVPDLNQALIKVKRGRLFPWGLIKLLWYKRKIKGLRIMALGVMDGYRKMGIEACLYGLTIKTFQEKKFEYAEASWTLEHNTMVNSAIEQINGKLYRKYRILEKSI
ncbi:hypothetical protein [Pedobacter sp. FW305-3-2-15-E-R2A2]|uniref:hypothetical protein n=1 Tax=Pedobacter sp. FW305-3-2-15-E-R2A2 TaxID=3140251 RepID=UPI003140682E